METDRETQNMKLVAPLEERCRKPLCFGLASEKYNGYCPGCLNTGAAKSLRCRVEGKCSGCYKRLPEGYPFRSCWRCREERRRRKEARPFAGVLRVVAAQLAQGKKEVRCMTRGCPAVLEPSVNGNYRWARCPSCLETYRAWLRERKAEVALHAQKMQYDPLFQWANDPAGSHRELRPRDCAVDEAEKARYAPDKTRWVRLKKLEKPEESMPEPEMSEELRADLHWIEHELPIIVAEMRERNREKQLMAEIEKELQSDFEEAANKHRPEEKERQREEALMAEIEMELESDFEEAANRYEAAEEGRQREEALMAEIEMELESDFEEAVNKYPAEQEERQREEALMAEIEMELAPDFEAAAGNLTLQESKDKMVE